MKIKIKKIFESDIKHAPMITDIEDYKSDKLKDASKQAIHRQKLQISDNINKGKSLKDYNTIKSKSGAIINMPELMHEIELAKSALISESAFFRPFVNMLYTVYTWDVKTMATDGTRLFINPEFAYNLSWDSKVFVIAHEIMHNLLRHIYRAQAGNYSHKKFNYAGDYEINAALEEEIFPEGSTTVAGGLINKAFLGLPAEEIYKLIKEPTESGKDGNSGEDSGGVESGQGNETGEESNGQGNETGDAEGNKIRKEIANEDPGAIISKEMGDRIAKRSNDGISENEAEDAKTIQNKWDRAMISNKKALQTAGKGMGGLISKILSDLEPSQNWKSILATYMKGIVSSNDIKLGNKRYLTQDYFRYKSADSPGFEKIYYLIDSSGSVNDNMLSQILSDCNIIAKRLNIKESYYITFDSAVYEPIKRKTNQPPPDKISGRGGTDFKMAFKWIDENIKTPEVILFLTDGYEIIPPKPKWHKDLIWVVYNRTANDFNPGYGKVVCSESK